MSKVITLTTDLGVKDYYVAAIKAQIFALDKLVNVFDISHSITPFHIGEGAFNLSKVYQSFPKGSVHIFGVKTEVKTQNNFIAFEKHGHFFIGADNGFVDLLLDDSPNELIHINKNYGEEITFPTKDVFVKVAVDILNGIPLSDIGDVSEEYYKLLEFVPTNDEDSINGLITYFDNYGNLHTNIHKDLFHQIRKSRKFNIIFRGMNYKINKIHQNYLEVPEGEKLAIFNHSGYLEISINNGNAKKLFGVKEKDAILIEFS